MMSIVIPARIERGLMRKLEELVKTGYYVSRSDVVRDALRELLAKYESLSTNVVYKAYAKVVALILARFFGGKISDIILYGSVARGNADEESDIDLLILTPDDPFQLMFEIVSFLYPIELELGVLFSINTYRNEDFAQAVKSGFLFEKEVSEKGISLLGGSKSGIRAAKTS